MTRMTVALALFTSLAIVPATALAMEPYLPKTAKAFAKADANSDGQVTAAELTPKVETRFARFDADHNGEVSAAEIDQELRKALERRRDRILAALDADRNGAISRAELDAAVDRLIAAADGDHDGGVSLDEARKYRVAKLVKPATGGSPN